MLSMAPGFEFHSPQHKPLSPLSLFLCVFIFVLVSLLNLPVVIQSSSSFIHINPSNANIRFHFSTLSLLPFYLSKTLLESLTPTNRRCLFDLFTFFYHTHWPQFHSQHPWLVLEPFPCESFILAPCSFCGSVLLLCIGFELEWGLGGTWVIIKGESCVNYPKRRIPTANLGRTSDTVRGRCRRFRDSLRLANKCLPPLPLELSLLLNTLKCFVLF